MKINPVAIQSYQQLNRREPNPTADDSKQAEATGRDVTIQPQSTDSGSDLAVRAPGNTYADHLTAAEREALDLLFKRFSDTERFGAGYSRNSEAAADDRPLGKHIDLKV